MAKRLGKGSSFLLDLENRDVLLFEHFSDEITDTVSVNWGSVDVIGRSSPIRSYASTGPRSISLELNFFISTEAADLISRAEQADRINDKRIDLDSVSRLSPELSNVVQSANFCRSLLYPEYGDPLGRPGFIGDLTYPPPKVLVYIGSYLRLVSIVTSCDVTWKRPYTLEGLPMFATANMTFESVNNKPFGRSQIRSGRDLEISISTTKGII